MSGGFLLRPLREPDRAQVTDCWSRAFGDPPALADRALTAGNLLSHGICAETEDAVCSLMFAFEGLTVAGQRAAYLYALCTRPEYRGRGLAAAVLEGLTEACFSRGADLVFLSPAEPSLAAWYQTRFGMIPVSGTEDFPFALPPRGEGSCLRITPAAYLAGRTGQTVDVTLSLLSAQEVLCGGGGFFRLETAAGGGLACAAAEDGLLSVRELLGPAGAEAELIAALAAALGCTRALLRRPGEKSPLLFRAAPGATLPASGFFFPFSAD